MALLLRGEIRQANIERDYDVVGHEQGNPRPALILSNDHFNAASQLVIVSLISSSEVHESRPTSRRIQSVQMPKSPSWVLTDQVRTLSANRMGHLYGKMADDELLLVIADIFRLLVQANGPSDT